MVFSSPTFRFVFLPVVLGLAVCVAAQLGALGYFKYANFFVGQASALGVQFG